MASLTVNIPPVKAAERAELDRLVHDLLDEYFERKQDLALRKAVIGSKKIKTLSDELARLA